MSLRARSLRSDRRAALALVLLAVMILPFAHYAADFGLQAGVDALREVAGLQSISTAVPVTLQLLFTPEQQ